MILWQKKLILICLSSISGDEYRILETRSFLQDEHLHDVISPKIEKIMTINSDSKLSRYNFTFVCNFISIKGQEHFLWGVGPHRIEALHRLLGNRVKP